MEPKRSEVTLFTAWFSSYCTRVELALKLKGVPFECIEEDLKSKSELLLKYNAAHKKVPVLLHNGKPVVESLIILEYIDENWKNGTKLLPDDPHERAKVRFWANYYDQKFMPGVLKIITSRDTEREKTIEEFSEMLKVFEQGIARDFPQGTPFTCQKRLGFLDIVVGSSACNYRAFFEPLGVDYPVEKNQEFFSWVHELKDCSLIKETLSPHEKMSAKVREKFGLGPEN